MSSPSTPAAPRRSAFRFLHLGIAVAAVALFLWLSHPADVADVLAEVKAGPLAVALLLNFPLVALLTLRSDLLLRRMGHHVPLRLLVPATVLGNVAGNLTPAASGEFLRAAALRRTTAMSLEEGVSLIVYERAISAYLIVISTVGLLGLEAGEAGHLPPGVGEVVAAVCFLGVLAPWLCAVALGERVESMAPAGGGLVSRVLRYLLLTAAQVRTLLRDVWSLLVWSAMTLGVFAVVAGQILLLARAVDASISFDEAWVTYAGTALATIVSLLPFGIGIGDGSMAALVNQAGGTLEQGLAVAILFRLTTLPLVLFGAWSHLYLSRDGSTRDA